MSDIIFKTPEGRAEFMTFYDSVLDMWPVPMNPSMCPPGLALPMLLPVGRRMPRRWCFYTGPVTTQSCGDPTLLT